MHQITMYRLMLYFLLTLVTATILLSIAGILHHQPQDILLTTIYLAGICNLTNYLLAKLFNARTNLESASITALILTLIVGPLPFSENLLTLTFIGISAMASKYVFALRKKHIFNPAAIAVFLSGFLWQAGASWWIGSMYTLPLTMIGGLLVLLKLRRFSLVIAFLLVFISFLLVGQNFSPAALLSSPIWFFAFVMLVEPQTSPSTRNFQLIFGCLTAFLLIALQKIFPTFPYSLESSLLAGNLFSFLVTPTFNVVSSFVKKTEVAQNIWAFYFEPMSRLRFTPGQYMEWTYPHKMPDSRGVRRYFTIASSPNEKYVMVASKIAASSSSFKKALMNMKPGEQITALGPSGEFTLPKNKSQQVCFIAGGIGITPFRSMVKNLLGQKENRDIVLLYSVSTEGEVAFKEIFDDGAKIGLKSYYVYTEKEGFIDKEMIKKRVPDYKDRVFYISGPEPMVDAFKKILVSMGVKRVKTDFFPGYSETHQPK